MGFLAMSMGVPDSESMQVFQFGFADVSHDADFIQGSRPVFCLQGSGLGKRQNPADSPVAKTGNDQQDDQVDGRDQ